MRRLGVYAGARLLVPIPLGAEAQNSGKGAHGGRGNAERERGPEAEPLVRWSGGAR